MNTDSRASGVLLHMTSLPGTHGSGDFGLAAYRFVDWLVAAGQSLWQTLPLCPVGPGNSPYQSPSAFAGNPLLVALEPLVASGWLTLPQPDAVFDVRRVQFERVLPWRQAQLRAAAAGFPARASAAGRADFAAWCEAQREWLDDYALFMAIRATQGDRPWWDWPRSLRDRDPAALAAARAGLGAEIHFWQFVQWCFDTQLAALKAYANTRGVALVGDLPIFVAHDSADCWARPDLYHLDAEGHATVVAGVPPDDLGPEGQRWGNPLYRWERMAAEGYAWWTARMRRALVQADWVRIDHFLGFSAYWEIPADSAGAKVGRWVDGPGQALFDAMAGELGPLPIIAEDLGLITPEVRALRDGCGFPGMKIVQFAFGGDASHEFLPHNCVPAMWAYTGTHDNDTARGWWDNAPAHERAWAAAYLDCGAHDLHWAMMRAASLSVARKVVFPLQDVLGLASSHRMNLPGTVGDHNWAWRFGWDMLAPDLAPRMAQMAAASGRAPFGRLDLG
jgi:4-alpha-glucanotransferase